MAGKTIDRIWLAYDHPQQTGQFRGYVDDIAIFEQHLTWPNSESSANSDRWIALHHEAISQMQPRVLAINFVNDPAKSAGFSDKVHQVIDALREGSRYHGYRDSSAPAFLDYQIAKLVDMTDKGKPPAGWNHRNSSKYPLKCQAGAHGDPAAPEGVGSAAAPGALLAA